MRNIIAAVLIPAAGEMHNLIMTVPLGAVRALVFVILAALAFWVILLRPQMPEDHESKNILYDLRFFALAVIILQAFLYWLFMGVS